MKWSCASTKLSTLQIVFLEMHRDSTKQAGVSVWRNTWKDEWWENFACGEVAAGSFGSMECVGECQQKIFAFILKWENDHRNIIIGFSSGPTQRCFPVWDLIQSWFTLPSIFESLVGMCKLSLYWMCYPTKWSLPQLWWDHCLQIQLPVTSHKILTSLQDVAESKGEVEIKETFHHIDRLFRKPHYHKRKYTFAMTGEVCAGNYRNLLTLVELAV